MPPSTTLFIKILIFFFFAFRAPWWLGGPKQLLIYYLEIALFISVASKLLVKLKTHTLFHKLTRRADGNVARVLFSFCFLEGP